MLRVDCVSCVHAGYSELHRALSGVTLVTTGEHEYTRCVSVCVHVHSCVMLVYLFMAGLVYLQVWLSIAFGEQLC